MSSREIHACKCPSCQAGEQKFHYEINLFVSRLDEQQRRWFVALEALRLGYYGGESQMARITGFDPKTIRRGRRELEAELEDRPPEHVRQAGAGRPTVEQRDPALEKTLIEVMEPETAGDPMVAVLYKRSSLRNLSARLKAAGHPASHPTVKRLLKKLGYSPKVNARRKDAKVSPPERDAQFKHIEDQKHEHMEAGEPVISVDSKKKGTHR